MTEKRKGNVIDIDKFLASNSIALIIKGKEYIINDIPLDVREEMVKEEPDPKAIVSKLLGLEKDNKVLDGYGFVALSHIVQQIHENLLPGASPKGPSKD